MVHCHTAWEQWVVGFLHYIATLLGSTGESGCLSPITEEVEKGLPEEGLPWVMARNGQSPAWGARVWCGVVWCGVLCCVVLCCGVVSFHVVFCCVCLPCILLCCGVPQCGVWCLPPQYISQWATPALHPTAVGSGRDGYWIFNVDELCFFFL